MENNKNFILAMVLSLAVLIGWQSFVVGPRMEAERKVAEIEAQRKAEEEGKTAPPGAKQPSDDSAIPSASAPATSGTSANVPGNSTQDTGLPLNDRKSALAADPRVEIDSDRLTGSINLTGGRIDDLRLKDYHETIDKTSPTIVLLSPKASPQGAYFAEFGWIGDKNSGNVPQANAVWKAKKGAVLSTGSPVELTWKNDKGLTFYRSISIDADYMF